MSLASRLAALQHRLAQPLPGEEAHRRLSISDRPLLPLEAVLRRERLRVAAVLVTLFPDPAGRPQLLLTRRHAELRDHAGQVSFPGGRMEAVETAEEAALREAWEELALDPRSVSVLGRLSPLWIPPSDYLVYPVLGHLPEQPAWTIQDAEVAEVIVAPLAHFADPARLRAEWWELRGERRWVPFFEVAGHRVWGATAMILAELVDLWQDLAEGG